MVPWLVLAVRARAALPLVVLIAGCAVSRAESPALSRAGAADFHASDLRQVVVLVRVLVAPTARLSDRERREAVARYETALLEALDARAILVRDIRSVDGGVSLPDAGIAAARAREVGADHAVVADVRVERQLIRVCEETRRPRQGEATAWRQDARIVRARDGAERVHTQLTTPDVEAECEGPQATVRVLGMADTTAAAVDGLLSRMLAR